MYAASRDPYCYPGTAVLINRLGLRDQSKLDAFEAEVSAERATQPLPAGRLSYAHYRAIHRHLFRDVYAWAGKLRTVRISKGGSSFCYPEHIDGQMRRLFGALAVQKFLRDLEVQTFAAKAGHFLTELNAIHPFREGNGRTQLSFLVEIAERAGYPISLSDLKPKAALKAFIASFNGNERPLRDIIERAIGPT
jgi:cell filamentation protein, protein adenylyltransferase